METLTTTTTKVEEKVEQGEALKTLEKKEINSIVFIVFAEQLGFVSPFITIAENACKGKDIPSFMKKFFKIESKVIYKKMLEKYSEKEIREWWDRYYEVLLSTYEDAISKQEDGIPF